MKRTNIAWLGIIFAFCIFLYLGWGIFTPFIISLTLTYLWSPVAAFVERHWKMPRWIIALVLVIITIGILLSIILLLLPLIYEQVLNFIALAPHYKEFINDKVMPTIMAKLDAIDPEYLAHIKMYMSDLFSSGFNSLVIFIKKIWSSGFAIVDFLWFILLVPFITFHLIKDWDKLLLYIKNAVPIKRQNVVHQFFIDVNNVVSSTIRGQFNLCIIWAIYYTIVLSIIELDHSMFLGITTGLINFIPFLGLFIAFFASTIVAYLQFGSIKFVALTSLIYLVGGVIDSGFLTPKLVGTRVGLHAVWAIFAILLGGKLFGFMGMLVAIPCGAVIGLLIKLFLEYYYKSSLYLGDKNKIGRA